LKGNLRFRHFYELSMDAPSAPQYLTSLAAQRVTFVSSILGSPSALHKQCVELCALIDDMFETMRQSSGVGLAGPQIGLDARITVFEFFGDETRLPGESPVPLTVLINPRITSSAGRIMGSEGCFSVHKHMGIISDAPL